MQENKDVQSISFKERLVQIYEDLDNLNLEEAQKEIDEIKSNLQILIEACKTAEDEKDKILINELIENKTIYKPLQKCNKSGKPNIIQKPKEEKENTPRKDWIIISVLLAIIIALGVCIAAL